jgi:hypothetical protein
MALLACILDDRLAGIKQQDVGHPAVRLFGPHLVAICANSVEPIATIEAAATVEAASIRVMPGVHGILQVDHQRAIRAREETLGCGDPTARDVWPLVPLIEGRHIL